PQGLIGLLRTPQLLRERPELRVPLLFERRDLALHLLQRLAHWCEGGQHGVLLLYALGLGALLGASVLDGIPIQVVLPIAVVARASGLGRAACEIGSQARCGDRRPSGAGEPPRCGTGRERGDDEEDDQRSIHTAMMPPATDIARKTT